MFLMLSMKKVIMMLEQPHPRRRQASRTRSFAWDSPLARCASIVLRVAGAALTLASATLALAACSGSTSSSKHITLVAYSTPQQAFASLIEGFRATSQGKGVSFSQSYGPSGDQSRAVAAGLSADVVNFSLEPDVTRLVKAGLVAPNWSAGPTHGIVSDSVVVIVVRRGNPKHITGWSDLVKPGVEVLTPNPFTSGGARWNVMAAYGAQLKEGKTPAQAQAFLGALFRHVVSQDSSARNALQTFLAGRGDALLDYESEAIADHGKGAPIQYVVPRDTILIQSPIAILGQGNKALAQRFVSYLLSPAGQRLWAQHGYRPVTPGAEAPGQFPSPPGLFTIDSLGGWTKVGKQFFEAGTGIVAKIEQSLGVSTAN
jgi:sulfate/thiosulfate transport system substrate-binding protein